MPYNPGSAYPRKTVYSPPTEGQSFQRAVNAPDVSSSASFGAAMMKVHGRGTFAAGAAYARGASAGGDFSTGFEATQRRGIIGDLQSRYMQQRGLQHGQPGEVADGLRHGAAGDGTPGTERPSSTPTHGNTASIQQRQASSELSDNLVEGVLTGSMPGDTGAANTKKSSKKANPGQQTLF